MFNSANLLGKTSGLIGEVTAVPADFCSSGLPEPGPRTRPGERTPGTTPRAPSPALGRPPPPVPSRPVPFRPVPSGPRWVLTRSARPAARTSAVPGPINEGGSGALNLCLLLRGGRNSTPRARPPPRPPARPHFFEKPKPGRR